MSGAKTPVFLLTGFLGSGKTTLLNKALTDPALANTAVVVNELGEIGLDNLVIAQATDNVVLLDAGCLCCANTGALHETLADLNGRRARGEIPPFERVIIETSGAADPAPLINVLLGHPLVTGAYAFEATACAVDAQHFLASRDGVSRARQAGGPRRPHRRDQDRPRGSRAGARFRARAEPRGGGLRFGREPLLGAAGLRGATAPRSPRSARSADGTTSPASARTPSAPPRPSPGPAGRRGRGSRRRSSARDCIRVKGLLHMEDSGEIALVQGVQGVFHPPQRLREWPDADHGNRLVCIARDLSEQDLAATLPALNTPAGTQAVYSMKDLRERQEQR